VPSADGAKVQRARAVEFALGAALDEAHRLDLRRARDERDRVRERRAPADAAHRADAARIARLERLDLP